MRVIRHRPRLRCGLAQDWRAVARRLPKADTIVVLRLLLPLVGRTAVDRAVLTTSRISLISRMFSIACAAGPRRHCLVRSVIVGTGVDISVGNRVAGQVRLRLLARDSVPWTVPAVRAAVSRIEAIKIGISGSAGHC